MSDEPIEPTTFGTLTDRLSIRPQEAHVDEVDLRLLRLLLVDGRATLKSLATAVNLSAPAVSERIAKMEADGVIRGHKVDIDWGVLGYTMTAYLSIVIRANFNRDAALQALQSVPEVEEIAVVTGSSDLLVRVRTVGFDHLKDVIAKHLWSRSDLEFTETKIAFFSEQSNTVEQYRLSRLLDEAGPGRRPRRDAGEPRH